MLIGREEVQELKGGVEGSTVWILIDIPKNGDRVTVLQRVTVRGGQNLHEMESVIQRSTYNYDQEGGRWYNLMAWASKLGFPKEE